MKLSERIAAFNELKIKIDSLADQDWIELSAAAQAKNGWFSHENVKRSLEGISYMLDKKHLERWIEGYNFDIEVPKIVGIIPAGNIPLVGFHDLLCVLLSGHFAAIKPSSDDEFLTHKIIEWLFEIEPKFKKNLELRDKLTAIDSVIATGSDNTSRYFEYYFKDIPHLIRKNRTSIAILDGSESKEEIEYLSEDIFSYFGLGCRNVSKIFTPVDYDLRDTFPHFEKWQSIIEHHKYRNNYDYHKSIFLVNKTPHLDTGFMLTTTTDDLFSPISVLYHQAYDSKETLQKVIESQSDKIQCVIGKDYIPFGKAQRPDLWDYADNVDTMAFLLDKSFAG